jgi:hypothetical protein
LAFESAHGKNALLSSNSAMHYHQHHFTLVSQEFVVPGRTFYIRVLTTILSKSDGRGSLL